MTEPILIHEAPAQLRDLVTAMRPDWPPGDVEAVITDARQIPLPWPHIAIGLARLACDPEGRPRELIPPHLRHTAPPDPEAAHRGADYARELYATRHDTDRRTP
jgi:hypothetical protein